MPPLPGNAQPRIDAAPLAADDARWFLDEVRPHEPTLRSWLRSKFPSLPDLDDIVQETYARLFRARRHRGRIERPKPYLYATARNAALDVFRHERVVSVERLTENAGLAVLDHGPDAAEAASRDDELALLAEAIRTLPPRCREILILRKLHGLSQKQIAEKLGLAENTVAAQASLGVKKCAAFFRERQSSGK